MKAIVARCIFLVQLFALSLSSPSIAGGRTTTVDPSILDRLPDTRPDPRAIIYEAETPLERALQTLERAEKAACERLPPDKWEHLMRNKDTRSLQKYLLKEVANLDPYLADMMKQYPRQVGDVVRNSVDSRIAERIRQFRAGHIKQTAVAEEAVVAKGGAAAKPVPTTGGAVVEELLENEGRAVVRTKGRTAIIAGLLVAVGAWLYSNDAKAAEETTEKPIREKRFVYVPPDETSKLFMAWILGTATKENEDYRHREDPLRYSEERSRRIAEFDADIATLSVVDEDKIIAIDFGHSVAAEVAQDPIEKMVQFVKDCMFWVFIAFVSVSFGTLIVCPKR